MDKIEDKELGTILIKRNSRAKHITARRKDGHILLSVPEFISMKYIETALLQLKPKLLKLPKPTTYQFKEGVQFQTLTFSVNVERSTLNNIYHKLNDGILNIRIPEVTLLKSEGMQSKIQAIIEFHLRTEAKRILPKLVETLANEYNFHYTSVSIQKSKTRWGSCSSTKKINLSYWCLMLPTHLIEFIVLHELCHTVEMNHGRNFWILLDSVTDNRAKKLTGELKKHSRLLQVD